MNVHCTCVTYYACTNVHKYVFGNVCELIKYILYFHIYIFPLIQINMYIHKIHIFNQFKITCISPI